MKQTQRDGENASPKALMLLAHSTKPHDQEKWARMIRSLNDAFRISFTSTELYCSPSILKFNIEDQEKILEQIREYRNFNEENDSDMTHQRGQFDYRDSVIHWEVYCADLDDNKASPDPANLDLTRRHMMVFVEEESWSRLQKITA